MTSLEQALDKVNQLPVAQEEIADDEKQAISSFHLGELTPQTADEVIAQLQKSLQDN